jgi:hypothetical protein
VDEHELTELFREAVRDTPPASFDERDISHASQRIAQRRRRSAVVGATIAAVLVFGGVVVGLSQLVRPQTAASNAAPGMGPAAAETGPSTVDGLPSAQRAPQSEDKASMNAPAAGQACGPVDRELADALAGTLPAAAGQQPVPGGPSCPPGARAAGYVVRDGAVTGVFSVVVAPAEGAPPSVESSRTPGTRSSTPATCTGSVCTVTAASGKRLTVRSEPSQGFATAPFADKVPAVAQQLASRF